MRRDPKYLLGKRFDNLKNEVTNTISGGEEKLVFDPMFEMNEEDFHRWAKLKKEPGYRAHKLIQRRAKEAREKAKNSIQNKRILKVIILYLITPHFLRMRKYIFFNFTHNLFFYIIYS